MSQFFGLIARRSALDHEKTLLASATNIKRLDLATSVADSLQNLLDFVHKAIVEDWCS